jgi:hypothetical protein
MNTMRYAAVLIVALGLGGCMSPRYAQRPADRDTLEPPPMTVKDVVDLSKASLSDSIIIGQIEATHSAFSLKTDDIISLKNAGVSENVITEMIRSNAAPQAGGESQPYPAYSWYPEVYYSAWGPYGWYWPVPRHIYGAPRMYGFPHARMGRFHFRR